MSLPFDATLKVLFRQDPAALRQVFRLPEHTPARTLNVDLATVSAATDTVYAFGDPVREIADVNFQSGPDPEISSRLLLYNALIHHKYGVPVRTVLVLLRPKADGPDVTGKLAYTSGATRVEFEYDVIRMWEQPAEPFLKGSPELLPLATLCETPHEHSVADGIRGFVREIERRLLTEMDHAQAVQLMTAAFILTGMRVPKDNLPRIYDGVRLMHESTAFDVWMEEGFEKGLKKGIEAGVEEGIPKGELRLLLRVGTKKFGAPTSETERTLKAVSDVDRLERMGEAVLTATTWQEVLDTL